MPQSPLTFDLAGRAVLTLAGEGAGSDGYVRSQMDPFHPGAAAPGIPEVRLECRASVASARLVERQGPAGDGVVTASDGSRPLIVRSGRACSLPDALRDGPARFEFEPGFPLAGIFGPVVRPALQIAMLAGQSTALHASSVELDGGGLAIAGWSESGKTETALAFMEDGARFISDKWTVLGPDGTLSAFPIGVGVRRWVLSHLPRLRSSLAPAARSRLAVARLASVAGSALRLTPPRAGGSVQLARELAERAVSLAERVPVTPRELRSAYGQEHEPTLSAPLRAVVVLTTAPGPGVVAEPADPVWAAERMVRSAAFERAPYFGLQERACYAFPGRDRGTREEVVALERDLLERALRATTVIGVHAPFPADPRPVASAIARCL
ncbi:MAG: hypothetical protein H0U84_08615 [Thermoleophilaceae bacterium]|nr:hypothetical protein [Thermoleophilaceae bacterium]